MNEETEALAYSQLLLFHADTITDSGVKEMVVNSAAELTILHLRVEALRRENERLLEALNRFEYSSDGHIKRYPEEEVIAALRREEVKP